MDVGQIISELHAELSRITHAIAALESLSGPTPLPSSGAFTQGSRRRLSAAARKRISEAAKKRWARLRALSEVKAPKAAKKVAMAPKAAPARHLSPAAKEKIAAAAKARWAARKAVAKTA